MRCTSFNTRLSVRQDIFIANIEAIRGNKNPQKQNELSKPLECKDCKLTFYSNLSFALHSRQHTIDGFYSCHMCEYRKSSRGSLKKHLKQHGISMCKKYNDTFNSQQLSKKVVEVDDSADKVPTILKCIKCDKQYKRIEGLRNHYSSYHKELGIDTSVVCDICGRKLSCKAMLKNHIKIHRGDRPSSCTFCSKQFTTNTKLKAHMRMHTGEKPYVCTYCGKRFTFAAPYRYHIKTHTGEKSWSCPVCSRGFISKGNMKLHLKTCLGPTK